MRMPIFMAMIPLCLAPLCLAGCDEAGGRDIVAGSPEAPGVEAPSLSLGGVDLTGDVRVLGTEPFWGIDVSGDQMTYSGVDRPAQAAPRPEPVVAGTTATWTTETEGGAEMTVTLADTPCSDGMSDRTYPLTARVEIGDETLNGCAASAAWMETAGEG